MTVVSRAVGAGLMLACLVGVAALGSSEAAVMFIRGDTTSLVEFDGITDESGTAAYQGPVTGDDENWKPSNTYAGAPLRTIVENHGGLAKGEALGVVAADGWYKILPRAVVYGETVAGDVILATRVDGEEEIPWEDAPMLVFLPPDEMFSNDDMLDAFGPDLAHYFGEAPSTTGMRVRNVAYLVVNYDGAFIDPSTAATESTAAADTLLWVSKGETEMVYTLSDLEGLETLTAQGTFTNSAGIDYTASYTGVPLMTLIGNAPSDATVRVTATDGYSMNYAVELLADTAEGIWVLAYRENGALMPHDPGPLRIVQIGESNPHFTSAVSAKMVERIELQGAYEPYTLVVTGSVDRTFSREELEAGTGCPCHTATVSVTSKGETHTYTGLPLWRLVGYVDDDIFPLPESGIHYNDEDFNDSLAEDDYAIDLVASDGYENTALSSWIARDDRFVVAFKKDGVFLDPGSNGYMRFVYDDSVELPEGAGLKSVKFLAEIRVAP